MIKFSILVFLAWFVAGTSQSLPQTSVKESFELRIESYIQGQQKLGTPLQFEVTRKSPLSLRFQDSEGLSGKVVSYIGSTINGIPSILTDCFIGIDYGYSATEILNILVCVKTDEFGSQSLIGEWTLSELQGNGVDHYTVSYLPKQNACGPVFGSPVSYSYYFEPSNQVSMEYGGIAQTPGSGDMPAANYGHLFHHYGVIAQLPTIQNVVWGASNAQGEHVPCSSAPPQ